MWPRDKQTQGRFTRSLLSAVLVVVGLAACDSISAPTTSTEAATTPDAPGTTAAVEVVDTTTGAAVVTLTFDGTSCDYQGPTLVEEGTVDLLFTNTADEQFAVAANQVEDYAIAAFLRDAEVGTDWDLPPDHRPGAFLLDYLRWPPVRAGESQEYSWMLSAGTYFFDCVLELEHVWRPARLDVVAEIGGATNAVIQPSHMVGGDLLLEMGPGSGPGSEAEMLLDIIDSIVEPFGVQQGTADHVANAVGEYGPIHIVTFTAARDNPRGGDPEFCVMFLPGGGGCGFEPGNPMVHGWGRGTAEAYGGADAAEAVFSTESGNTVSVLAVAGFVYAEWPQEWGTPLTVDFYDATGSLVVALEA